MTADEIRKELASYYQDLQHNPEDTEKRMNRLVGYYSYPSKYLENVFIEPHEKAGLVQSHYVDSVMFHNIYNSDVNLTLKAVDRLVDYSLANQDIVKLQDTYSMVNYLLTKSMSEDMAGVLNRFVDGISQDNNEFSAIKYQHDTLTDNVLGYLSESNHWARHENNALGVDVIKDVEKYYYDLDFSIFNREIHENRVSNGVEFMALYSGLDDSEIVPRLQQGHPQQYSLKTIELVRSMVDKQFPNDSLEIASFSNGLKELIDASNKALNTYDVSPLEIVKLYNQSKLDFFNSSSIAYNTFDDMVNSYHYVPNLDHLNREGFFELYGNINDCGEKLIDAIPPHINMNFRWGDLVNNIKSYSGELAQIEANDPFHFLMAYALKGEEETYEVEEMLLQRGKPKELLVFAEFFENKADLNIDAMYEVISAKGNNWEIASFSKLDDTYERAEYAALGINDGIKGGLDSVGWAVLEPLNEIKRGPIDIVSFERGFNTIELAMLEAQEVEHKIENNFKGEFESVSP